MGKNDSSIVASQLNIIIDKLSRHDQKFESFDKKFESFDKKFESFDKKFDVLTKDVEIVVAQNDQIHKKIDTVVRILNDHNLAQEIKIEKLQKIHPHNSHQPVVA